MKLTCYIHAKYDEYEKKYDFNLWSRDMSAYDSAGAFVGTHEFAFDAPPHKVLVNGTIAQYRKEQKKILAEAEAKRVELERRINELLCIEYKLE